MRQGGEDFHTVRFTPRKAKSKWSAINVGHVKRLIGAKRMTAAGLNYSYETRRPFDPSLKAVFEANAKAWAFFAAQPPGHQRVALWWIMNAKGEEARAERLKTLIADSAAGRRLAGAAGGPKKGA